MSGLADRQAERLFGWPAPSGTAPRPGDLCAFGAPSDVGNVVRRGAAHGPAAIRQASGDHAARPTGWDMGDVAHGVDLEPASYLGNVGAAARTIAARGLVPLMLGGDHSLTYAPVAALAETHELQLVWLDAHTDFSPWIEGRHHNHKQVLRRIAELPGVRGIVQLGYRGITIGDERALGRNARVVTSACARRMSADDLLACIPDDRPCYVSIDIDIVDPAFAPGTSTPVPGGLTPGAIGAFLRLLVGSRMIAGIDLTELNPVLDTDGQSAAIACDLLAEIVAAWPGQLALREARAAAIAPPSSPSYPAQEAVPPHAHPDL